MADAVDRAQALAEQQLQHSLINHNRNTQKMVNTNPLCDECGDEIPPKRRQLLPHAIFCVDCQTINEQRNR